MILYTWVRSPRPDSNRWESARCFQRRSYLTLIDSLRLFFNAWACMAGERCIDLFKQFLVKQSKIFLQCAEFELKGRPKQAGQAASRTSES